MKYGLKVGQECPWGKIDHSFTIGGKNGDEMDGVTIKKESRQLINANIRAVGTPSHGGYGVRTEGMLALLTPEAIHAPTWLGTEHGIRWYEEDCDMPIVLHGLYLRGHIDLTPSLLRLIEDHLNGCHKLYMSKVTARKRLEDSRAS